MKILLFDNYDSFTYNLLHILKEFGADGGFPQRPDYAR